jgi:hypothetical protein
MTKEAFNKLAMDIVELVLEKLSAEARKPLNKNRQWKLDTAADLQKPGRSGFADAVTRVDWDALNRGKKSIEELPNKDKKITLPSDRRDD